MRIRRLTEEGVEKFEDHLDNLEGSKNFTKPDLDQSKYSETIEDVDVDIDPSKDFETRRQMGEYLVDKFENVPVSRSELTEYSNMWTWLVYQWLENFTFEKDGKIDLRERKRYVCSKNPRRYYRHYTLINYLLVSIHGTENTKLFFECSPKKHKNTLEQLSAQNVLSNPTLVEIANQLYWNSEDNKVEKYAGGRTSKPGTAIRYRNVVDQLRKTYDLHSMEKKEIIEILPDEFDEWM